VVFRLQFPQKMMPNLDADQENMIEEHRIWLEKVRAGLTTSSKKVEKKATAKLKADEKEMNATIQKSKRILRRVMRPSRC